MTKKRKTYNLTAMSAKERGILIGQHIEKYGPDEIDLNMIQKALDLGIVKPVRIGFPREEVALIARAAQRGHIRLFAPLVAAGCDVNKIDIDGYSAMTHCADNGDLEGLRELRRLKAELLPKSALVYTKDGPLEMACRRWHVACVSYLMAEGAPLTIEKSRPNGANVTIYAVERMMHNVPKTDDDLARMNATAEILLTAGQPINPYVHAKKMDAMSLMRNRGHNPPAFSIFTRLRDALNNGFAAEADIPGPEGVTVKKKTLILKP